jgi:hypothetical protein
MKRETPSERILTDARAFWPAANNFHLAYEIRSRLSYILGVAAGQKARAPV